MNRHYLLVLLAALAATALAYLPGLRGPFLLDDFQNLEPLRLWRQGILTWQGVVFGNETGPMGRPLSMAIFLLNAGTLGLEPWHFKAVNLLLHLACGVVVAGFARRLVALDDNLQHRAGLLAVLLAAWWLILPIHVTTVLYVVQRMTQLSALFVFGGLWLYLAGRARTARGLPSGAWMLFAGVPLMTLAGALGKENGLLLPLLCGVLELVMFPAAGRPRIVRWFLGLVVVVPILGALLYSATHPGFVLGGYERRDFTLAERLLTQPRVLWDYVRQILVPAGSGLGLFQDDVRVSTSLFRPWTTILAIVGWVAALGGAWATRHKAPLVLAGLLLFLGGHALESSVFALEIAFLHRNYMPSLGILVATLGLGGLAFRAIRNSSPEFRRFGLIAIVVAGALLWSATFAQAWVWQSEATLAAHELEHNPDSLRARLMAASLAINTGQFDAAMQQIDRAEPLLPERDTGAATIWRMASYCGAGRAIPRPRIEAFRQSADKVIGPFEREAFDMLTRHLERETCPLDSLGRVATSASGWLEASNQSPRARDVWRFRYDAARLYARSGDLESGFALANKAFMDSGLEFPVGVLAFRLATSLGNDAAAHRILEHLESVQDHNDRRHGRTIEAFRTYLHDSSTDGEAGNSANGIPRDDSFNP